MAAATAAPEEMPQRRPSSSASRLAMPTLSLDEMAITSSIMSRFRTLGMKPAPMPWICNASGSCQSTANGRKTYKPQEQPHAPHPSFDHLEVAA